MALSLKTYLYAKICLFMMGSFSPILYSKTQSPILVTSIPKCGTHLLTETVSLLTGRSKVVLDYHQLYKDLTLPPLSVHQYYQHHIHYDERLATFFKVNNYKILFIYRDPRDQVISRAHWILAKPEAHPQYQGYTTVSALITRLIPEVTFVYKPFMPWMYNDIVCTVKFEDLVGSKGRGDVRAQVAALTKIANCLDVTLTQPLLARCIEKLFGSGLTFRKGQIGSWRQHFTPAQTELFKAHAGDLLIELGYEKNKNW